MEDRMMASYKKIRRGVVVAGACRREAGAGGEAAHVGVGVEVRRHERGEAKSLGDEVDGEAAIGEPAGGLGTASAAAAAASRRAEVAAVGGEVALDERGDVVVVARVDRRVAEHDQRSDLSRRRWYAGQHVQLQEDDR